MEFSWNEEDKEEIKKTLDSVNTIYSVHPKARSFGKHVIKDSITNYRYDKAILRLPAQS